MGNVEDRNVKINARAGLLGEQTAGQMRTLYLKDIRSGYNIPLISVKSHMCGETLELGGLDCGRLHI
jgi:hypothetical protein